MIKDDELIGSVEFGDWLIAELQKVEALAASEVEAVRRAAHSRRKVLDVAKILLLEFLTIQQAMFDRARCR